MTAPFREVAGGVLLALRVTPKSSQNRVTGLHTAADGSVALAVKVTAAPDKGKANAAVVAVLARAFGLPKSAFTLVSGETDRRKSLLVAGKLPDLEAVIAPYRNQIETDR